MKINPLPTVEELNYLLSYDADAGLFTWKKFRGNTAKAGSIAGRIGSSGYVSLCINGKSYLSHRIAWKMAYGADPNGIIDHIDGNMANNRLSNLRLASYVENQGNSRKPRHNTSGIKGVSWHKGDQCWIAQIKHGPKKIWLGGYKTKEEAAAAYAKAAEQRFGKFANTGEKL